MARQNLEFSVDRLRKRTAGAWTTLCCAACGAASGCTTAGAATNDTFVFHRFLPWVLEPNEAWPQGRHNIIIK